MRTGYTKDHSYKSIHVFDYTFDSPSASGWFCIRKHVVVELNSQEARLIFCAEQV